MATIQDAIKRLIYQFTSTGAEKVAADNNMVADSQAKLAVSAQTTTKASLDLEKSFENLERRFQTTAGVQQQYEAIQAKVNAAVAQHPELQARANDVLDAAKEKFDRAGNSGDAFSKVMESARGAALGLAAGIGPVGAVLGSFGPWGVAAAAGIGLVVNALSYMKEKANEIGDASSGVQRFADSTGLTVTQVRGLNEAGSELGVAGDLVSTSIQKFTQNLAAARQGSGELYDQLRVIDRGLADQIASTHDGAEALDVLAKAYNSTTDATTRAALARAAFGKGGVSVGGILGVVGDAGGVDQYSASVQKALGITDEWTKRVADLRNENKSLEEDLKLIEASFYTEAMLERQNRSLKLQLDIAKAVKDSVVNGGGGQFGNAAYGEYGGYIAPPQTPKSFAQGGDPVVDSAAIDAAKKATDGLAQANRDNLDATTRMAAASAAVVSALGSEATAAEKEQARIEALTVAFEAGKISAETYSRALDSDSSRAAAQVTSIAQAWGNVSQSTALALQNIQNQLPVAEAWTTSGKMLAQYQATYNDLLLKGKTSEEAAALAAKEYELSKANAVASAQKLVQSSQDNLDKIRAQGTEMEGVVASSIAYRDAIQAGATQTQAAAIAANTLEANMIGAAKAADQMEQAATDAYAAAVKAAGGVDNALFGGHGGSTGNFSQDALAFGGHGGSDIISGLYKDPLTADLLRQQAQQESAGISAIVSTAFNSGGLAAALDAVRNSPNTLGSSVGYDKNTGYDLSAILGPQRSVVGDKVSAFDSIIQAQNSLTTDKGVQNANIQMELSWLRTLPPDPAVTQKMTDLTNALNGLTTSTNGLNATNQDLLSPYYTQDPRTSHIGFRSQGMATGGEFTVPGGYSANDNMLAQIPVASGEIVSVRRPGQNVGGGGGTTISISMPITIQGGASKDEVGRTMYQAGQNLARQLQAASR
jgi:hypothetical protein